VGWALAHMIQGEPEDTGPAELDAQGFDMKRGFKESLRDELIDTVNKDATNTLYATSTARTRCLPTLPLSCVHLKQTRMQSALVVFFRSRVQLQVDQKLFRREIEKFIIRQPPMGEKGHKNSTVWVLSSFSIKYGFEQNGKTKQGEAYLTIICLFSLNTCF